LKLARKLADEGRIVIFISHRMSEIQNGCDTITILRNGTYAGNVKVDENMDMNNVISMMLGTKMSSYFPTIVDHTQPELAMEINDFKYNNILNGVDIQLHKGEVLGLGGLAGQGQAELLLSLYGVYAAKGNIKLFGEPVRIKSPKDAIRRGIALVPEERGIQGLFMPLSIGFNISIPSIGKLMWGPFVSKSKENALINKFMKAFAVKAESPEMLAQELSGGNQQKVVMAKIMSCKPNLLLLHDITRGVDIGTKKEMFSLVREFVKDSGKAAIFFSTDVEELVNVCDRVVVMYDGKVNADLKGERLTKENIVSACIGVNSDNA
jgi:ABC-type sugar transport system ATPase subunit